ncbi:MAG TPA: Do family serine endopeptidase [Gemmatimonadaceae bacterium]|nr:Do family serine endopeptidase [Gemmatimonadaceae bacterium]
MTTSSLSRIKFAGIVAGAFLGGLILASGFDRTPFSFAQQTRPASFLGSGEPVNPPSVEQLNSAFTAIAEKVTPAVVSIQAERTSQRRQQLQRRTPPGSLEDFFGQFDPRQFVPQEASGSGFIVSPDGYVLTNNHVVQGFDRVTVSLLDHRTFRARVVGRDPTTDVAVLKIDAQNLPVAALGDDEKVKIGEWVLAIGNPLGLDFTVTAGIVSAKGRGGPQLRSLNTDPYAVTDFIQTDAAINPGNSGGPLVNIRGEVIGINSAIASQTGLYAGYGFAIPINLARQVMQDIIAHGRVRRAVLGVQITQVTPEDAAVAGLKEITGVLVQSFSSNDSPAKRAGLEVGDVIVRADGREVDRVSTLQRIVRSHQPGESIEVEVMRYGQRKTFTVRLAEAPDSAATVAVEEGRGGTSGGTLSRKLGITVETLSEQDARANRVPEDRRGLQVVSVDPDGPARDRLGEDDVLVEVLNPGLRRPLRSVQDLEEALQKVPDGGYLSLLVYNIGARNTRVVNVRVGAP